MRKLAWTAWALAMLAVAPDLSARESSRAKEVPVRNVIYMMMLEEGYRPTSFDRSQNVALITTYSANNRVTDSAAAGTALASGRKTNNGMLGMTPDGETFESMMEKAMDEGWKAGLVVTVYLQHATPAAFYAHVPSRNDLDEISEQFVESGGRKLLAADRGDGKTLIDELKAKDYRVVYDLQEADAVDRGRIVGLFSEEYMPTVLNGRDENYLCDATKKALEILTNNAGRKGGFLLMVEGSQIDSEAHANNAQGILAETRDFDRAVGAAMDYADAHPGTLVVVTADHETSGLSITSNETDFTLSDSGVGYHFGTTGHSGTMVPVYLYGTGAERINGVMDNTELSKKIQSLMGLE